MVEMDYDNLYKINVGDLVKFGIGVYDPVEQKHYPIGHVFVVQDISRITSVPSSLEVLNHTQIGAYWVSHWIAGTELAKLIYG